MAQEDASDEGSSGGGLASIVVPQVRPSTAQTLSRRRRDPHNNRGLAPPAVDRTGTGPSTAGPS